MDILLRGGALLWGGDYYVFESNVPACASLKQSQKRANARVHAGHDSTRKAYILARAALMFAHDYRVVARAHVATTKSTIG